jgi:glutathione S-transferase
MSDVPNLSDLTVFHCPMTRSTGIVWLLEELGVPYQKHIVDVRQGRSQDYLKVNPTGKVPAIRHNGHVMSELAAITVYLGDAFAEKGLAPPPNSAERMDYLFWCFYRPSCVEPSMTMQMLKADAPQGMTGWDKWPNVLAFVEQRLTGREFIAADSFTGADVLMGGMMGWAKSFKFLPEGYPAIEGYIDRVHARPAYQAMMEADRAMAG